MEMEDVEIRTDQVEPLPRISEAEEPAEDPTDQPILQRTDEIKVEIHRADTEVPLEIQRNEETSPNHVTTETLIVAPIDDESVRKFVEDPKKVVEGLLEDAETAIDGAIGEALALQDAAGNAVDDMKEEIGEILEDVQGPQDPVSST